jgi:PPM family protein phosphatase
MAWSGSPAARLHTWAAPRPGGSSSQDALLVLPLGSDSAVLAVADGLGGTPGGAEAAARAVEALAAVVEESVARGLSLQSAILNGINRANESVLAIGTGAATTLAVAEISGGQVRAYNIGDSEVMVFGQRGRLKLRTISHSPVGFALQAGLVDHEEALHHQDRHFVSNVVGSRDMRIEVGSVLELGRAGHRAGVQRRAGRQPPARGNRSDRALRSVGPARLRGAGARTHWRA